MLTYLNFYFEAQDSSEEMCHGKTYVNIQDKLQKGNRDQHVLGRTVNWLNGKQLAEHHLAKQRWNKSSDTCDW